jgi:carboxymethylenebutenolidase
MKKLSILVLQLTTILSIPAQDFALQRLDDSPRHHEWVEVKNGVRTIDCFVAYPEKSQNTLAVVVIHENRGIGC